MVIVNVNTEYIFHKNSEFSSFLFLSLSLLLFLSLKTFTLSYLLLPFFNAFLQHHSHLSLAHTPSLYRFFYFVFKASTLPSSPPPKLQNNSFYVSFVPQPLTIDPFTAENDTISGGVGTPNHAMFYLSHERKKKVGVVHPTLSPETVNETDKH